MFTMRLSSSFLGFAVTSNILTSPASASCGALNLLRDVFGLDEEVKIAVHRSGESDACAIFPMTIDTFGGALSQQRLCNEENLDKFGIESVLTAFVMKNSGDSCGQPGAHHHQLHEVDYIHSFAEFCDAGLEETPMQADHSLLVSVLETNTLPCRFYTREGRRIGTLALLSSLARMAKESASSCSNSDQTCSDGPILHMTAVPAGRVFMFAPFHVGEKFVVDLTPGRRPVVVETLSVHPRLFELHGFFTREESEHLIHKNYRAISDSLHLQSNQNQSLVGKHTGMTVISTDTEKTMSVKWRAQELLGLVESDVSLLDELHLLRFEAGQAAVTHSDLKDEMDEYNYESTGIGSNIFATFLLYLNDLGENDGGGTVFEQIWPVGMTDKQTSEWSMSDSIQEFRSSVSFPSLLKAGSWEERMAVLCGHRYTVRPKSGRALLLYSQLPNGQPDRSALYGECPVMNGTKWVARLRSWSSPRITMDFTRHYLAELPGDDSGDDDSGDPPVNQIVAEFWYASGDPRFEGAGVYYDSGHYEEAVLFGTLGELPVHVNTFEGHRWHVQKGEAILKTFVIGNDKLQIFEV